MTLNITDSSRATGVNGGTLRRDISKRNLTATIDCHGHLCIDVMNLIRYSYWKWQQGRCDMYFAPGWTAGYILTFYSRELDESTKNRLRILYDLRAGDPNSRLISDTEIKKILFMKDGN